MNRLQRSHNDKRGFFGIALSTIILLIIISLLVFYFMSGAKPAAFDENATSNNSEVSENTGELEIINFSETVGSNSTVR